MKRSGIITLTTDFGETDSYVGAMKGVILSIAPGAKLVDITHNVSPGNIEEASFILKAAVPYFPPGTVHLAVVDPGVGSSRRPILVKSSGQLFVGPDNGLFTDFIHGKAQVIHLTKKKFFLKRISNTFHGRDIFAPAAARLSLGKNPEEMGDPVRNPVLLKREMPKKTRDGIKGRVIHIDRFGNLITNIPESMLPKNPLIRIAGREIKGLSKSYTGGRKGGPIAIIGSSWLLDISIRDKSAARELKARVGTGVEVHTRTKKRSRK